jgi:hypothetical protein
MVDVAAEPRRDVEGDLRRWLADGPGDGVARSKSVRIGNSCCSDSSLCRRRFRMSGTNSRGWLPANNDRRRAHQAARNERRRP